MRVLVTGATGFLGSYIVDQCVAQGDDVTALVRRTSDLTWLAHHSAVKLAYGDITDTASLREACRGKEVVYHSAARAADWGSRKQFYDSNVLGTENVLEACLSAGVKRLVYISSPSVVFDYRDEINIDERYPYPKRFANHYSETKAIAEQKVLAAHKPGIFTTVSLRPHAIWGPRDRVGFMPQILAKAKQGKLPDLSEGREVRIDMCYVENAALACLLASRAPSVNVGGKAFFITDGESVNAWSFLNEMLDLFGIPRIAKRANPRIAMFAAGIIEFAWRIARLEEKRRPPLTRYGVGMLTCSTTYSIEAARHAFGYRPRISVKNGVERLKRWVDGIGGLDEFIRYVE